MKRTFAIASAVASLLAVVGVGVVALANPSQASDSSRPAAATASQQQDGKARYDEWVGAVAAKLDIPASQLDTALRSAASDRVEQAAKDGKISQQRADQISQAITDGTLRDLLQQWRANHQRQGRAGHPTLRFLIRHGLGQAG
jgi:hypothetical protein